MRPTISWADLAGARVGVWGLGVEGGANLRKLRILGVDPVLVDDAPDRSGPATGVRATAEGGIELLLGCDVVVKTPGISRYRADAVALVDAGVVLAGGLGLWMQETDRDRVICVTGTKGKSTTTAMLGHLFGRLGYRCITGGNIGRPPWDPDTPAGADVWVIETSSYQATDVASSPPIVAVTSLHADHLNWHGDAETYYRDKLSLCTQPGAAITVANGRDSLVRAHAAQLGPRVRWVDEPAPHVSWHDAFGLRGTHNRMNAEIARAVLDEFGVRASQDELSRAAAGFDPLPSRMQTIATVDGVEFVDDSLSTNVLPTVAAVDAFTGRRVALLVGGFDRGIDYAPLAEALAARPDPLYVLTLPDSGPRIHEAFDTAGSTHPIRDCTTLSDAVRRAFDWARPDGVVLLSPAAPSFGHFRDYRDRAAAFRAAVEACASGTGE